ncbi:cephalosporin-C deacetylase [Paenibacillus castaneae]|uniref:acetylxylan esterase n=1 Tax=Paenibacillus castaneae TaxID=474957 RepID=UPI000C9D0EEE|nr:alpha/beta fold hydrolase [Paenibacillus castaneae]NIK76232.1 cephalosporin-C deacetylase [Paenibacillus castaneae]
MHAIDRRKNELEVCNPPATISADRLDQYWTRILESYDNKPLDISSEREESPFPAVRAERITYKGSDETPIHGLYLVPELQEGGKRLPCIVIYQGYTGDKGYAERYAAWLLLGYAVLAVDVRGQGGETGSMLTTASGSAKGWVSQGIMDKENSYYHAVIMDAIRAVDVAVMQREIDSSRIAVMGGSQGGGLALLCAALNPKVCAVVADIPNMCHLDYGIMNSTGSLTEIAQYLKRYPEKLSEVLDSLAHFDLINLAERIKAPVLMSVGWKDTVCLPETVYAVYNRIRSDKQINDYPFSGHEVSEYQTRAAIEFLKKIFNRD